MNLIIPTHYRVTKQRKVYCLAVGRVLKKAITKEGF
jgi:hypothetical protein